MRFDAKLIQPDEPPLTAGGELDLPADLAALGQQLGDDAAHLAAKYPAATVVGRSPAPSARPLAPFYLSLGASLVAAVLVAVMVWQLRPSPAPVQRSAAVSSPVAAPATFPSPAAPAASGSISLVDLSGPELEALLDLLHDDPNRSTSISF
jgi:hypothetical protein